jgi:hypothetical protein
MKTYNFKEVQVIVGAVPISGFAEGGAIRVARNADSWSLTMGADGEGTRARSNDQSGTIELDLMQSSESNAYLSSLVIADELEGASLVPVLVKDSSGLDLHAAEQSFVLRPADAEYESEAGLRTWTLVTDRLDMFLGGN